MASRFKKIIIGGAAVTSGAILTSYLLLNEHKNVSKSIINYFIRLYD